MPELLYRLPSGGTLQVIASYDEEAMQALEVINQSIPGGERVEQPGGPGQTGGLPGELPGGGPPGGLAGGLPPAPFSRPTSGPTAPTGGPPGMRVPAAVGRPQPRPNLGAARAGPGGMPGGAQIAPPPLVGRRPSSLNLPSRPTVQRRGLG